MPRPRETSDEALLEAARACFLEHGPGVAMTVVARRAGVSSATLFQRFETKEALLVAALGPPAHVEWIERVESGPDDRPLRDQLFEIAEAMAGYFRELSPRLAMLRAAGISRRQVHSRSHEPPPLRARRALEGWLARAEARGDIRPCDRAALATALIATMQATPLLDFMVDAKPAPGRDSRFLQGYLDALWNGLSPVGRRQAPRGATPPPASRKNAP